MHRFFHKGQLPNSGSLELSDPELLHKITDVLRLKNGSEIILFNGQGQDFKCRLLLSKAGKNSTVQIEIISEIHAAATEAQLRLKLYPSLFKKNRFEWMLEKCTEVGVTSFNPISSQRSIVKLEKIPERWRKIIEESSRQSGRTVLPEIAEPQSIKQALALIAKESGEQAIILVAAEGHGRANINTELNKLPLKNSGASSQSEAIHLFIGPEGGWDISELALFQAVNARFLSLGSRILRAETASIVFSAFCLYAEKEEA